MTLLFYKLATDSLVIIITLAIVTMLRGTVEKNQAK